MVQDFAIKAAYTHPQKDILVTRYGETEEDRRCTATFAAVQDRDGYAIGCETSAHALGECETTTLPSSAPVRRCERASCAPAGPGTDRRRHNLYVGQLLESEAKASTRTAAARLEEEALLSQLLAAVCA